MHVNVRMDGCRRFKSQRLHFKLLFETERSQGLLPAIFLSGNSYYFLLNVKFTSKAPVLDWAAWSHMPLNRVVVTRPKVYWLASLEGKLIEEERGQA